MMRRLFDLMESILGRLTLVEGKQTYWQKVINDKNYKLLEKITIKVENYIYYNKVLKHGKHNWYRVLCWDLSSCSDIYMFCVFIWSCSDIIYIYMYAGERCGRGVQIRLSFFSLLYSTPAPSEERQHPEASPANTF